MGEAIAAFRKYALRAREALDVWWFDANCDNTQTDEDDLSAEHFWAEKVHRNVSEMTTHRYSLEEYVASLDSLRHEWEYNYPRRFPRGPANRRTDSFYAARVSGRAALRALADEAIREAVDWGPLATRVERYCRTLLDTIEQMVHGVAAHIASNKRAPAGKYLELLREWFDAFKAGGGVGEFVLFPPNGKDGHGLFTQDPEVWRPKAMAFLRANGYSELKANLQETK